MTHGLPPRFTLGAHQPGSSYCSVGDPPYWASCMTLSQVEIDGKTEMISHCSFITSAAAPRFFCPTCESRRAAEGEASDCAPEPTPPAAVAAEERPGAEVAGHLAIGQEHASDDDRGGRALLEANQGSGESAAVEVAVDDGRGDGAGEEDHPATVPLGEPWGNDRPIWETLPNRRHAMVAREVWEERAAIMEYDGGLSRAAAEHAAYKLLVAQVGA